MPKEEPVGGVVGQSGQDEVVRLETGRGRVHSEGGGEAEEVLFGVEADEETDYHQGYHWCVRLIIYIIIKDAYHP